MPAYTIPREALGSAALPEYARLPRWQEISGMTRSSTYVALANGNIRAIKHGKALLVHVQSGLAWLNSLPAAKFREPKSKKCSK